MTSYRWSAMRHFLSNYLLHESNTFGWARILKSRRYECVHIDSTRTDFFKGKIIYWKPEVTLPLGNNPIPP